MTKRTILLTAVFATLLSAAFSVQAENYDYYWKGGSGNYFVQTNWQLSDGTAAPVALDSNGNVISAYVVADGSSVSVNYSVLGPAVRSLTIGGGTGSASVTRSSYTFTIDSDKSISVLNNGSFTVGNTLFINANGTMTVNGGSLSTTGVDVSGTFDYTSANNFVNANTININAGGSFNIAGSGQFRMNGTYSIMNIMGGSVYIDSTSYIGVTANGVINQSGGNATFNKSLVFGWGAGNGTYNLSGGTLTTTDNAGLWCSKTTGFNTFNMTGGTANFNKAGNSFAVGLYEDGTGTQWTPRSVANVFNLNSGTVNAADTFAIQYGGTLNVAKTAENTLGDGVLNAKAITLTNNGNLNMSSGTINVGEGGITSSDGAYTITLSGGTFGTKGSNWSSALNAGISSNAVTFAPETGKTITWSGILSGAGGVTKSGDGTLTLVGANTYSGTTTISSGTLKLIGDGTLGTGAVVNEASLEFAYDTEKTFTNAVSGNGTVTKTGAGRLKINAANGFQASELIVSNGRLDFLGTMTGGITVNPNTVFSPGNSVGIATVNGVFTLSSSNASLIMEIGSAAPGENDGLDVSGALDLNDGLIYLQRSDSFNLTSGTRFYALLNGSNSGVLSDEDFINKYVRAYAGFTELEYVQMTEGDYAGKYAITGLFDANAIPEPSTWLLLVLGTAGLFYWRKKK